MHIIRRGKLPVTFAGFLSVLELFAAVVICLINARPMLHSSKVWTAIACTKYPINAVIQAFHCSLE